MEFYWTEALLDVPGGHSGTKHALGREVDQMKNVTERGIFTCERRIEARCTRNALQNGGYLG